MTAGARALVLGAVLMLAATGCAHRVPAAHVWTLWGTVVDFGPTQLSVRHKSGRVVTVELDDATMFSSGGRPAGRTALAKSARVAIDVEALPTGGQRAKAVRIVWGGA